MRRIRVLAAACLVLVWLGAAAGALAATEKGAAGVTVSAPGAVYRGQPFFVRVAAPGPLHSVAVEWGGKTVRPSVLPGGSGYEATALLGVGLDEGNGSRTLAVEVEASGQQEHFRRSVEIRDKTYPEQRLNVARKYTELSEEDLRRHRTEQVLSRAALDMVSPIRFWTCPFEKPVPGEVSSEFGLRRFFNGEPRKPHSGLDLRGGEGESVHAAGAGEVVLAGEHYFAGNSVYIDHGQGVVSMYFHLSRILVEPGETVARGEVVGLMGSTGRVTGPHLHFGVSVLGKPVAPEPLLGPACGRVEE